MKGRFSVSSGRGNFRLNESDFDIILLTDTVVGENDGYSAILLQDPDNWFYRIYCRGDHNQASHILILIYLLYVYGRIINDRFG